MLRQSRLASLLSALFIFASGLSFAQNTETLNTGTSDTGNRQVVITEYGGPEVLKLVHHTERPTPAQGEVRVRVLAAGVSFTDTMIRKGIYPGIEAELPYAPGYDLVGIVDALGPGVTGLEVGQRVADLSIYGAYADYVVRPAEGLVMVPPAVKSTEAVSLILSYVTAYQMMHRMAEVQPGQTVLIHGASGGVGTALAQLGKIAGLKMIGTASTAKQDYVANLGVTPVDYKTESFETRVMEETSGAGVDVVFDAVGVDNFKRSYQVLNATGKLIPYGFYNSASRADAGPSLGALWEFIQLAWLQFTSNTFSDGGEITDMYLIESLRVANPAWFKDDLSALFKLLADGALEPNLWAVLPLEDAALAHKHFEDGKIQGKIVLELAQDTN